MNDLVRPSSLLSTGLPPSPATGVAGTVAHPPPDAARLAAGTILRGVVVSADPEGLLVRTELGDLRVATKAQPAPASEVILQVRSTGAQLHVLLMQGRAPPAGPSTDLSPGAARPGLAAEGRPQGPAPPPVGPAAPVDHLTVGQTVRAILRAPLPLAPAAAPLAGIDPSVLRTLSQLPPGSALTLRLLAAPAPTAVEAPPPSGAEAATRGAGNSPSAIPSPTHTAAGTAKSGAGASAGPLADAGRAPGAPSAGATPTQTAPPARPATLPPPTAPGPNASHPGQAPSGTLAHGPAPSAAGPSAGPAAPAVAGTHPTLPPAQAVPGNTGPHSGQKTGPAPAGGAVPQPSPGFTPAPRPPAMPTAPAPAPSSPPPQFSTGADGGVRFSAVVTQVTAAGNPVLASPLGTLVLETPITVPQGGRLTVELPRGGWAEGSSHGPLPPSSGTLTHAWPALREALELFREIAGPGAPPVPDTIPQPGTRLASSLLFVLAALSGGHIDRWLGPQPLKALKAAGREGLAAQLGRDFAQMSRLGDAAAGEWRLLPIPLWDGQAVQPLRLFLRQRGHGDGDPSGDERDEATRFILEVEMSRLGELQLDGLVRDKRFDLMFRSRSPLPKPLREGIRRVYQEANEAAGYTGQVAFQASRGWQHMPLPDSTATPNAPLVV